MSFQPCHCVNIWLPSYYCQGLSLIPEQTVWDLWWTKWHWWKFFFLVCGFYTVIVSPPVLCIHAINAVLFRHHTPFTGQNQGCRICHGLNHTCIKYNCKCTVFWKYLRRRYAHVPGKHCFACSRYRCIRNRYFTCILYWFYW